MMLTPAAVGTLVVVSFVLAMVPVLLSLANLPRFRGPPAGVAGRRPVSVLVPARNEEREIARLVRAMLASEGVDLEVVVLDDASEDRTAELVASIAVEDPRVRLLAGRALPDGWCGKQHACWQLAQAARHDTWLFCDVDVMPTTDAVARSLAFLDASEADLIGGFPRQLTGSFLEWLLLPLIHFILLGFLPLERSRRQGSPALAAGCGQWFVTRREAYRRAGGHAAIRASLHDGVMLPRAYRQAGLRTDVFDASGIASCRMYRCGLDVWHGLAKNATEGVGAAATIVPFTILLGGGQVLPWLVVAWWAVGFAGHWPVWVVPTALIAGLMGLMPRLLEARRFGGSVRSVAAHPLAVAMFLVIQWYALARKALGLSTTWRGRTLAPQ
jgi:hypothetical protein